MTTDYGPKSDSVANKYGLNLIKIQFNAMVLSMLLGFVLPIAYVAFAYSQQDIYAGLKADSTLEVFFWSLIAISILGLGLGLFLRKNLFSKPLIASEAAFAHDFTEGVKRINTIVAAFANAIGVYGIFQFFMGADFEVVMLFSIFAIIASQILRLRGPFLEKALVTQDEHVSAGRFRASK